MRIAFIIIWLIVLVCLALSPFEVKAHLHSLGRYHHLYHLLAFLITAILLVWNVQPLSARLLSVLFAVALAFATEWLELWRFHNPFEWIDVLSDCEGIVLGVLILTVARALARDRQAQLTRH